MILTFKCGEDSSIVCFRRRLDAVDTSYGTYLGMPDGQYALIERATDPEGRALSILPSSDVEKGLKLKSSEGDRYVCLEMEVKANRLYPVVFRLRKSIELTRI